MRKMNKTRINDPKEVKYHITHAILPTIFDYTPSREEIRAALPILEEMLVNRYPNIERAIRDAIREIKLYT